MTKPIDSVEVTFTDGTQLTLLADKDKGFYRESRYTAGDKELIIREVYITDGVNR